jgi:hypothetical protein
VEAKLLQLRLLAEATAIAVLGVVLSAVLYSDAFRACCMDSSRELIGWLTLPAILFASIVGGGVHGATRAQFTLGLLLELLSAWTAVRIFCWALTRRRATTS